MSGRVIWITGLSGAGKTTLARALKERINTAILLDGDVLREALALRNTSFDYDGRKAVAFTYARICKMLTEQGFTVIIATISLFHDVHTWNREHVPHYLEVFLDVSEQTRRQRDSKGLYQKQMEGKVVMAGIETAVEFPLHPHIVLTESFDIAHAVNTILAFSRDNTAF